MTLPQGYPCSIQSPNLVCKLQKTLYDYKQVNNGLLSSLLLLNKLVLCNQMLITHCLLNLKGTFSQLYSFMLLHPNSWES